MVIKDLTSDKLASFYKVFSFLMDEGYNGFPEYLKEYFLNNLYPIKNFEFWLGRNIRKILLCLDENDNIIGFLMGDHTYGGVGFISWVGILPEHRKKGCATEMFKIYEDYVRSRKGFALELFTFDSLLPFYTKQGFKEIGRRDPGYFGQKNVIMFKQFAEWDPESLKVPAVY